MAQIIFNSALPLGFKLQGLQKGQRPSRVQGPFRFLSRFIQKPSIGRKHRGPEIVERFGHFALQRQCAAVNVVFGHVLKLKLVETAQKLDAFRRNFIRGNSQPIQVDNCKFCRELLRKYFDKWAETLCQFRRDSGAPLRQGAKGILP